MIILIVLTTIALYFISVTVVKNSRIRKHGYHIHDKINAFVRLCLMYVYNIIYKEKLFKIKRIQDGIINDVFACEKLE